MAGHSGEFEATKEGLIYTYEYEVEKWRTHEGDYKDEIHDGDLPHVEDMVIKITDEEGNVEYETIVGPMDDWDFVEDILEYDWGDEGTRGVTS